MRPSLAEYRAPSSERARLAERLRRFLQAYWLRPENAFWMTLRSDALAACSLERPALDLSCGDGVFSFLHCGGVLDPGFDVFTAVTALDRVRNEHCDMFNFVNEDYDPPVIARPANTISVGTDLKPALLAKAQRLRFYDRLVEHDHNRRLPFDDDVFQTVYCNAAYWVKNISGFLAETSRITSPKGRVILQVKLDSVRRYSLEAYRQALGDRFLEIIGRGRSECWPSVASRSTWEARFRAAGLSVESATPFVTRTHARIWDVGLRPIAPMLVRMANALSPDTRLAIKSDWVDLFAELLAPLCDPRLDLSSGRGEPAEMQYVLTPVR